MRLDIWQNHRKIIAEHMMYVFLLVDISLDVCKVFRNIEQWKLDNKLEKV